MLTMAYYIKSIVLLKRNKPQDALDACNQALASIARTAPSANLTPLLASIICCQGLAFKGTDDRDEALAAFDYVTSLHGELREPSLSDAVVIALVEKAIILDEVDNMISDSEFSLLLNCLAERDAVSGRIIQAIVYFVFRSKLAQAIELIQTSPAVQLLLPLLTALQQELGVTTHVAKEIDEVATDIRLALAKVRSERKRGTETVLDPGS